MALQTRKVPLWVLGPQGTGGLDTKTNPKMLAPGSVLEATNVDEFRPGEFRVRRGYAVLQGLSGVSGAGLVHPKSGGSLALSRAAITQQPWVASTPWAYAAIYLRSAQYFTGPAFPMGTITANPKAVAASGLSGYPGQDPDIAKNGQFELVSFSTAAGAVVGSRTLDTVTRAEIYTSEVPPGTVATGRPIAACTTANYFVSIFVTSAGGLNAIARPKSMANTTLPWTAIAGIGAGNVSAAQPWLDAYPAFGTDTVLVAFRAAAGGVTVFTFDATTGGAVLGPSNIAAADATMALGWVQDPAFTNSRYYLATAGGTNGIVYHTLTSALGLFASTTMAGARTAGVRQVTGFLDSGVVRTIYDVMGTNGPPEDCVRVVRSDNVGFEYTVGVGYSLATKPGKCNGNWVCVGSYTSSIGQSHYAVLWPVGIGTGSSYPAHTLGMFLFGEGAGRRTQSSLSSAVQGTLAAETGKLYVAVGRRRSIQTPGSAAQQQFQPHTVELSDVMLSCSQAKELGGTYFVPGAIMQADDSVKGGYAVLPTAPEVVVATAGSIAGGALTALGTYSYRFAWKRVDSSGRVLRSASCPAQSVTLTGGQNTTVTQIAPPPWVASEDINVFLEGYRQGPAATGASGYNLIGSVAASPFSGGTTAFIDLANDTTANAGEYAYFNGNVLENFAPPGHTIMDVGNGRVWVVNAEYPSEVWYSKEYKPGVGLGFNPQNTFRVEGDGRGAILGMANLDGRQVFFKDTSIWVVSGDGPNDLGQGSFANPQAVSLNIGCLTRASIVRTPDGVLFQANTGGIWLLGRDLSVSPVGTPVDAYLIPVTATAATPIVAACMVSVAPQVRLCLASGRVLVFNYLTKRWTTYVVPVGSSTIISCVDTTIFGWCYELADGSIYQESQTALTDEGGVTISPVISFPHLQLSGLNGYERFRGLDIAIDVVGNFTLAADAEFDFSGAVTGTPKTIALTTATPTAQVEYTPPEGRAKCSAVRPVLTITGAAPGSSFRLAGAVATIGVKKGSNIPAQSRMT